MRMSGKTESSGSRTAGGMRGWLGGSAAGSARTSSEDLKKHAVGGGKNSLGGQGWKCVPDKLCQPCGFGDQPEAYDSLLGKDLGIRSRARAGAKEGVAEFRIGLGRVSFE